MIELICIGTLITIVIIISDRQKSKKYRKKHKTLVLCQDLAQNKMRSSVS